MQPCPVILDTFHVSAAIELYNSRTLAAFHGVAENTRPDDQHLTAIAINALSDSGTFMPAVSAHPQYDATVILLVHDEQIAPLRLSSDPIAWYDLTKSDLPSDDIYDRFIAIARRVQDHHNASIDAQAAS